MLPSNWKVDETSGETRIAAFYGPPGGQKPFSQLMGVYFHPASDPAGAARGYLASTPEGTSPAHEVSVGALSGLEVTTEHSLLDIHLGQQRVITRTVVAAVHGGFFSLEHTWPTGASPAPAFDEMVRSFRPAPAAK